jgi:hypothetical protein
MSKREQIVPLTRGTEQEACVQVAHIWTGDEASGPGNRSVIEFTAQDGIWVGVGYLTEQVLALGSKLVAIKGSEPFDQAIGLFHLVRGLNAHRANVWVFSGYTLAQIIARTLGGATLQMVDKLVIVSSGIEPRLTPPPVRERKLTRHERIISNPGRRI